MAALRLGEEVVGALGGLLLLLVGEFLRGLLRLGDNLLALQLGLLQLGGARLLGGLELGLHLLGVFEAGVDLLLALLDRRHDGLEGEPPEQESDDREVDDLGEKERDADAEVARGSW